VSDIDYLGTIRARAVRSPSRCRWRAEELGHSRGQSCLLSIQIQKLTIGPLSGSELFALHPDAGGGLVSTAAKLHWQHCSCAPQHSNQRSSNFFGWISVTTFATKIRLAAALLMSAAAQQPPLQRHFGRISVVTLAMKFRLAATLFMNTAAQEPLLQRHFGRISGGSH